MNDLTSFLREDIKRLDDLEGDFLFSTTPMGDRMMAILQLHEQMARKMSKELSKEKRHELIVFVENIIATAERKMADNRLQKKPLPENQVLTQREIENVEFARKMLPIYKRALNIT